MIGAYIERQREREKKRLRDLEQESGWTGLRVRQKYNEINKEIETEMATAII